MKNKRLLIVFSCCLVLAAVSQTAATFLNAPHNGANSITCVDCHSSKIPDTGRSLICESCHNGIDAPLMLTHSDEVISGGASNSWSTECLDCHNPHFQFQLANFNQQDFYLATGQIDVGSITDDGSTSTFTYSLPVYQSGWDPVADNADWGAKSSAGRGLILVMDPTDPSQTFEILSADDTQVIVNGVMASTLEGHDFGVIYGQMIRTEVNSHPVIFTGPNAFATDDTCVDSNGNGNWDPGECTETDTNANGICQVCHDPKNPQNPTHWLSDGTLADHYSHAKCTGCHLHESGFKGGGDGPKHNLHNAMTGVDCVTCHGSNDPPFFADGQDLANTTACLQCHYNGALNCFAGGPPASCQSDTDCSPLETCSSGSCYTDCQTDTNCSPGEMCIDDKCSAPCPPNVGEADFKNNWHDANFDIKCNGCHNGRLGYTQDESGTVTGAASGYIDQVVDTSMNWIPDDIWAGYYVKMASGANKWQIRKIISNTANTLVVDPFAAQIINGDDYLIVHLNDVSVSCGPDCSSCHDGKPGNQPVVGMQSNGHSRLASSEWVRQFDCYYCHSDTVDTNWNINEAYHVNGAVDVALNLQWQIVNQPAPYYTGDNPGTGEDPYSCYSSYCHSDGTTQDPEMRAYSWFGGKEACNSCHGHAPDQGGCDTAACHPGENPPRTGAYWDNYPEKKWLSAMPMYENAGVLQDKANSHYRHLFTGFSCDDCHFDTIEGGGCLDCHTAGIPPGDMAETAHIDASYHVNRNKDVVFKKLSGQGTEGSYDPITKTCSNTYCHTGSDPQWGGSVYDAIVCRDCHSAASGDVDDFGKFNDLRARIDINQWESSGHGRKLASGIYPSGNPPADFPDNGCWYCHDSNVLHQNEERPFRLIQHDHFSKRFEKECVFCHMTGDDYECLTCHDDPNGTSLAPQLADIPALPGVINPPYTVEREDHSGYTGGCDTVTCHVGDTTRHDTGAGTWVDEQKEDVKNAYMQMGVCLKCHDDDSGGQCESCHTGPQYALGFDPADNDPNLINKTSGKIVPQVAKAASFHFGHLHQQDYELSLTDIIDSGTITLDLGGFCNVDADCSQGQTCVDNACDRLFTSRMLTDTTKDWKAIDPVTLEPIYQMEGRSVILTINSGPLTGQQRTRSIVRVDNDTIDTLIVSPPFFTREENEIQREGDTYEIQDVVWKGGKFCWDCHDPHGDDNIYMIQNEVATRTDGRVGKPIERAEVFFTRKTTGLDYVRVEPNPATDNYDGLCNVCHTAGQHYTNINGDGHNSGRICTECHEHRFTNSHASGQTCDSCHDKRPLPRHTAFGQSRDCTKCHKDAIGNRMNIMTQFSGPSHHVQGAEVTNKHCYACHWESTEDGTIDPQHHQGYNFNTYETIPDANVDLVIWQPGVEPTVGERPTVFTPGVTAISFLASDISKDTGNPPQDLADQRQQIDNITVHCLGCHSEKMDDAKPFDIVDPDNPDCKTPRQYAWDNTSIEARYDNQDPQFPKTTSWGKYAGPNVADKTITKAFSAHGNAVAGGGGWDKDEDGAGPDTADGVDETVPDTRSGAYNVQCFDCHSSHGSMVGNVTSSYVTFNGTKNGGNLKETQAGKGGYTMTYMATANPDTNSVNPYEAGAGQCFDCHETEYTDTQISPIARSPWGYFETFGATDPIIGYRDNPRFSGNYPGERFGYRANRTTVGGHFNASSDLANSPMGTIDGLCTPCHDPHGISPTLGSKMAYSVPLLKGTYMSSPYKEDAPPMTGDGYGGTDGFYNRYNGWNGTFIRPYPQKADPQPTGVWRTDRNTFNQGDLSDRASHPDDYGRISEESDLFAGLCLRCHPKASLTSDAEVVDTDALQWKSVERIHRTVKGWGWTETEDPREHSFTCSKCHQPHASGLPRLMQTNCLNYAHRGQQESGGRPDTATSGSHRYEFGRFPNGWTDTGVFTSYSTAICHGAPTANGSSGWPDNQRWNDVTPWEGGQ